MNNYILFKRTRLPLAALLVAFSASVMSQTSPVPGDLQVGQRPYFLTADMVASPLKDKL